ncbi:hypothetical protein COCSADRAFT_38743 [Bipolaris sorokiniana ND90Pr]|uniref:SNF7 family protein n=1 Tax=Cochliobolus sativus (strain ND90Pr / ATCC 201652) TaxID=665912 RepID=M2SYB9_COCSN|nr:uncharacterized protein COCSADRAFT_38743 [Bipolaris sorokiniana ND90Pr]EMD61941.1 hypothetical protein COCSADRAFT_38743 [Bipolaris sorokiniana ND90Pr]
MLDEATTKRDRLASQLHEAKANMTKLRRSDRTKEKTQQQNIHLKALLHRQSVKYNTTKYSTAATFRGVTAALNQNILQSALSAAIERIDELEARGQALLDALLDALEEQGTSSEEEEGEGEGEEEYDDSEAVAKLLKAQVKLDGVLRDKGFTLERRTWRHLLRD